MSRYCGCSATEQPVEQRSLGWPFGQQHRAVDLVEHVERQRATDQPREQPLTSRTDNVDDSLGVVENLFERTVRDDCSRFDLRTERVGGLALAVLQIHLI